MDGFPLAPDCIRAAISGFRWSESCGGESGASVFRLESPGQPALYMKHGTGSVATDITAEMIRLRWLAPLVSVPEVRAFFYCADQAWLLTAALPGVSAYESLNANPGSRSETVKALAKFLRDLHAFPAANCPFNSDHALKMAEARRNIDLGIVDESDFDPVHVGWTAEQVWAEVEMLAVLPLSFDRVVTHGDFSLGNILIEDGSVTGCIDVGRAGLADPYLDLAILWNNLEEFGSELQSELFSAYGIATPDARKLRFYLCLDELF